MKKYVKPVLSINEELAEGVYANSGGCWTVSYITTQPLDGNNCHVYEVYIKHEDNVQHLSDASTVVFTFNYPIAAASAQEYDCTVSGNVVTVVRTRLADAYITGDQATYKLVVTTGDATTTQALAITSAVISCTKAVNVQGGGADGN